MTFTLAIAAAHGSTSADDVLSIGANAIAQVGGSTIAGSDGAAATITSSAGIGTGAGTITVVA